MPPGWKPCRRTYRTAPPPRRCRRSATSTSLNSRRSFRPAASAEIDQRDVRSAREPALSRTAPDRPTSPAPHRTALAPAAQPRPAPPGRALPSAPFTRGRQRRSAEATSEFYIAHSALDGIPYWDTGAPGLRDLGDLYGRPADPANDIEPVDSSAAAITAQGLLRFGTWCQAGGRDGKRYRQAGLTILKTLLDEPYLSRDPGHQGPGPP